MRLLLRSLVPRVYQPCVGVTANLHRAGVTARAAQTSDSATPARPRAWRKSCFVATTSKALKEAQCRVSWLQAVNDKGIRGPGKTRNTFRHPNRPSVTTAHRARAAARHRQESTQAVRKRLVAGGRAGVGGWRSG